MQYTLRYYQQEASDAGYKFLTDKKGKQNGFMVLSTAAGKSLIVADLSNRLDGNVLVLQPSKELLEQNYQKYLSYGNDATIYSASFKRKEIGKVTFATIGSIYKKPELFEDFKYIIVDECHLLSVDESSMHRKFLNQIKGFKIMGLTATPYKLKTYNFPEPHSKLNFINRMRPKVFQKLVYVYQNQDAVKDGFWSPLIYMQYDFDTDGLKVNTTGANYTDNSVKGELLKQSVPDRVIAVARKLISEGRKHVLIFMPDILIADYVAKKLGTYSVTSKTKKKDREKYISDFKNGKIPYLVNVNVLSVGFDFPEIDGIIDAYPTMSLARYYQRLGRAVRPDLKEIKTKKDAVIVDLVGNYKMFGRIEDLKIENLTGKESGWCVTSNGNVLTNVPITKGENMSKNVDYQIYTDGSANWRTGDGGCATVFVKNDEVENVYSKGLKNTKTGRSEIHAILMALENVPPDAERIVINSDSEYCVNTIEKGWLNKWIRGREQKKNMDLWLKVKEILDKSEFDVKLQHVKGHNGNLYNELADSYAYYRNYH